LSDTSKSNRLVFVDQYRGLIMVLMALDHALFFWSNGGRISNEGLPLIINGVWQFNQPDQFSALGYLVMLLSSLAAPGFLFLSGYVLSRSLKHRREKGMTPGEITRHLFQRGLILIVLQILVISPAFNLPTMIEAKSLSFFSVGTFFSFSVLSTIGTGFIFLALMQRFSPWVGFLTALILYAGEQVFLPTLTQLFPTLTLTGKALISYLLLPIPFKSSYFLNQNFPVIPWLVPISLGWLFGQTFKSAKGVIDEGKRFLTFGVGLLVAFFALRLNHLGDYLPYNGSFSSLFILSKYPPSLDYFLFYTGIMFLLFYTFIHLKRVPKFLLILEDFGQVPLFFYSLHLWVYALIPLLLNKFNVLSLELGMIIWILGLSILYPLSKGYLNSRTGAKRLQVPVHTHSTINNNTIEILPKRVMRNF